MLQHTKDKPTHRTADKGLDLQMDDQLSPAKGIPIGEKDVLNMYSSLFVFGNDHDLVRTIQSVRDTFVQLSNTHRLHGSLFSLWQKESKLCARIDLQGLGRVKGLKIMEKSRLDILRSKGASRKRKCKLQPQGPLEMQFAVSDISYLVRPFPLFVPAPFPASIVDTDSDTDSERNNSTLERHQGEAPDGCRRR